MTYIFCVLGVLKYGGISFYVLIIKKSEVLGLFEFEDIS